MAFVAVARLHRPDLTLAAASFLNVASLSAFVRRLGAAELVRLAVVFLRFVLLRRLRGAAELSEGGSYADA